MQELIEGRDYRLLDESLAGVGDYLQQTGQNAFYKLFAVADRALSGRKGQAATLAFSLAGVTTDKQAFKAAYSRHSDAINEYFEHVDLAKIGATLEADRALTSKVIRPLARDVLFLGAGLALGALLTTTFTKDN
jgi:hypothetical protein